MRYLDLTLPGPAENLALDEALLEEAESTGMPLETLRLWEAPQHAVVIGRSSHMAAEVRGDVCRELNVPVLRRISGGAAVVVGPGCLMYAVVLSLRLRPHLRFDRSGPRPGPRHDRRGPATVDSGPCAPRHLRSFNRREEGLRQQRAVQTRAFVVSWHVAL